MKNTPSMPDTLGLSFIDDRVNFTLYAKNALKCTLLIYKGDALFEEIHFDPAKNRTGHLWHLSLPYRPIQGLSYLYVLDDIHILLDPYAKFLNTSTVWGSGAKPIKTKGVIQKPGHFDWEGTQGVSTPLKDLIIYEMHTRSFTLKAPVAHPGTFLGIIDKIPYLKDLGINAIELMPIHEFNECEVNKKGLFNYWGYSPIAYFAFMQRYSTQNGNVLDEFKTLVKALHKENIALIVDVVYNHTAEGGVNGPTYHFKELDPHYYLYKNTVGFIDYSGCGNTLDANHFPSMQLILDSLKYLCIDCQVDGFRFDLASTFYRDTTDTLSHPRIMEALLEDPVLSKKILIAEAWDAKGLYQVGRFPKPFADWNGFYRDKVRAFLKNDAEAKGGFADALSGSASLYFSKTPALSINFITAHDGFTLNDLFSYNHKHNLDNLEENKDGSDNNYSYNWGHEGPSNDLALTQQREKLQRVAQAILMLSLGTPMLLMGDEYGHTRNGNNNPWCHDSALNHFLWDKIDPEKLTYLKNLIALRKNIERLTADRFYTKNEVSWHGSDLKEPQWDKNDGFLLLHLHSSFCFVFNISKEKKSFLLPHGQWIEVFHSGKNRTKKALDTTHAYIDEYSAIVLKTGP